MTQRTVIVAKIQPGSDEQVAKIFAQSDSSELPRLAGVRHRSLFVLDDVYVHLIESEGDLDAALAGLRDHKLFREINGKLQAHIQPYNPATWQSPKDAMARLIYDWDAVRS
jgi:cyclase